MLTSCGVADPATEQPFAVAPDSANYRIWLPDAGLLSDPVPLSGISTALLEPAPAPTDLLAPRDAIKLREGLQGLTLPGPDGVALVNSGPPPLPVSRPSTGARGADTLIRVSGGAVLTADHGTGFFLDPDRVQVPPRLAGRDRVWQFRAGLYLDRGAPTEVAGFHLASDLCRAPRGTLPKAIFGQSTRRWNAGIWPLAPITPAPMGPLSTHPIRCCAGCGIRSRSG